MKDNKFVGSSLDDFLKEEGIYEEVKTAAIKKIIAESFADEMKRTQVSKAEMARRMKTSRTSVDRLLDVNNGAVTLNTLIKAAQALGRDFSFKIEFAK